MQTVARGDQPGWSIFLSLVGSSVFPSGSCSGRRGAGRGLWSVGMLISVARPVVHRSAESYKKKAAEVEKNGVSPKSVCAGAQKSRMGGGEKVPSAATPPHPRCTRIYETMSLGKTPLSIRHEQGRGVEHGTHSFFNHIRPILTLAAPDVIFPITVLATWEDWKWQRAGELAFSSWVLHLYRPLFVRVLVMCPAGLRLRARVSLTGQRGTSLLLPLMCVERGRHGGEGVEWHVRFIVRREKKEVHFMTSVASLLPPRPFPRDVRGGFVSHPLTSTQRAMPQQLLPRLLFQGRVVAKTRDCSSSNSYSQSRSRVRAPSAVADAAP